MSIHIQKSHAIRHIFSQIVSTSLGIPKLAQHTLASLENSFLQWTCKNVYRGEIKEGKFHGHGVYRHPNGMRYDGQWKEGQKHGEGTYFFLNNEKFIGNWVNGVVTASSDQSILNLQSPMFIHALVGLPNYTPFLKGFPLAVFSTHSGHKTLQNAHRLSCLSFKQAAEEIAHSLDQATEEVLYPGVYKTSQLHINHAIGIGMKKDGDKTVIRIFNSSPDPKFHPQHGKYCETQWGIEVPSLHFSEKTIYHLLQAQDKQSISWLYDTLLSLPKASQIKPKKPILQTEQKSNNCATEWIFAYLKNTLSEKEYHTLRLHLFQDCLKWMQNNAPDDLKTIEILKSKIHKRIKKLTHLTFQNMSLYHSFDINSFP